MTQKPTESMPTESMVVLMLAAPVVAVGGAAVVIAPPWMPMATLVAAAFIWMVAIPLRDVLCGAYAAMGLYAAVLGWAGIDLGVRGAWGALFLMIAAYGGADLQQRVMRERWGPTMTVTALSLSIAIVGSHVAIARLILRSRGTVSLGDAWVPLATFGLVVGAVTLAASYLPWRALRRAALARGGRVDEVGHVRFFDGAEGRTTSFGAAGEVIGWVARGGAHESGYRQDAGPAHVDVFRGDRGQYVDAARRRAMRVHTVGLAVVWLTGGPLIGARLAGLF